VQCGERVYLAIDPTLQEDKGFPGATLGRAQGIPRIMLRAVEAAEAQSTIGDMQPGLAVELRSPCLRSSAR